MTRRRNAFERVKQYYVDDGGDIHWWIDEDELEDFKNNWLDGVNWEEVHKPEDVRELSGHEWNKWMVGQPFGDYEGTFIDEDCPECGHFLVLATCNHEELAEDQSKLKHCSEFNDCSYETPEMKEYCKKVEEYWTRPKEKKESPKFREPGQTLEQFCEKYKIELSRKVNTFCVCCKMKVEPSDYYVITGYAMVVFGKGHAEKCENKHCPVTAVPIGKERDKWSKIL